MQKKFRNDIHREICRALIRAIKRRKPNDYDDQASHEIIKAYFHDAEKGIKHGLCFCPDNAGLIEIFENEIKSLKGK